jgi:predicted N-acetyltransferase YhbS
VHDLGDGFTLREATSDDHDAIVELCREVFSPYEAAAVHHVLTGSGYGPGRWTVVTDPDGEVVSCCALLLHVMRYGRTELTAAQIEFVATREAVRKRGFVRSQFDVHHRWADGAGALVQFVTGIPYFYRRLDYGYGVDFLPERRLLARPDVPEGWIVEPATAADTAAIRELDRRAAARADLALVFPDDAWDWLVAGAPKWEEELVVARRDGAIEAFGGIQRRADEGYAFTLGAARQVDAARAVIAHADEVTADLPLWVVGRPGDAWGSAADACSVVDPTRFNAVYARIPDPAALLDHLRPELSARLAASPVAGESGELKLSFYGEGVILAYDRGEVTGARPDPEPELDPLDEDGAGVPPDALAALILGRFGAAELAHRFDDVGYVKDRALMAALFPRMHADLSAPL